MLMSDWVLGRGRRRFSPGTRLIQPDRDVERCAHDQADVEQLGQGDWLPGSEC